MGLILTLRKGEDFFVGDSRFVVETIFDGRHFILYDPERDTRYEITEESASEIDDNVLVCAAVSTTQINISIEAPREMPIVRGSLSRSGRRRR